MLAHMPTCPLANLILTYKYGKNNNTNGTSYKHYYYPYVFLSTFLLTVSVHHIKSTLFYFLFTKRESGGGGAPRVEFRGAKIQRYVDTEIRTRWVGEKGRRRPRDRPIGYMVGGHGPPPPPVSGQGPRAPPVVITLSPLW